MKQGNPSEYGRRTTWIGTEGSGRGMRKKTGPSDPIRDVGSIMEHADDRQRHCHVVGDPVVPDLDPGTPFAGEAGVRPWRRQTCSRIACDANLRLIESRRQISNGLWPFQPVIVPDEGIDLAKRFGREGDQEAA